VGAGQLFARAIAMHPEPVPTSAISRPSPLNVLLAAGADFADGEAVEARLSMTCFGFRPGNQTSGVTRIRVPRIPACLSVASVHPLRGAR